MIDPVTDCAIRQLHARYVDAVWRKDSGAFAQCWTEAARWRIAGIDARGREAVTATFDRLIAPSEAVLMLPGALLLSETLAEVVGRITVTELIRRPGGASMRTIGRYHDRYAEEGGRWRFAARHWDAAYRGSPSLQDEMLPREDHGPPPGMPLD
ncbi:MAG: nuclear transport factor 2 family protein [Sphingomonadales bacterium]|nr:nuclear transport factor 2 family protein [Sphingomonadales bacterium]